jgi:hypothetical protein
LLKIDAEEKAIDAESFGAESFGRVPVGHELGIRSASQTATGYHRDFKSSHSLFVDRESNQASS